MKNVLVRGISLTALLFSVGIGVLAAQGQAGRPRPPQLTGLQMRGDGPAPAPKPFSITRSDPELDTIVAADAKIELMASGFGINEGVLWIRDGGSGYLLLSSLIDNVMYKITPDRKVSVFMEKAGYSGDDPSHVGLQTRAGRTHVIIIGPNCATLDAEGRLVWCAGQDQAVKRLEKDGTRTVLADGFEGKHFNGPNDIAIKSDGAIYIADSDVGLRDGGRSPLKQMPNHVWRWKDGQVTMALDERTLGAGPGVIRVTSPAGKLLGLLNLPIVGGSEPKRQICATNLAFGGDGHDLYVSACDAVYKIRLKAEGIIAGPDGRMVSVVTPRT